MSKCPRSATIHRPEHCVPATVPCLDLDRHQEGSRCIQNSAHGSGQCAGQGEVDAADPCLAQLLVRASTGCQPTERLRHQPQQQRASRDGWGYGCPLRMRHFPFLFPTKGSKNSQVVGWQSINGGWLPTDLRQPKSAQATIWPAVHAGAAVPVWCGLCNPAMTTKTAKRARRIVCWEQSRGVAQPAVVPPRVSDQLVAPQRWPGAVRDMACLGPLDVCGCICTIRAGHPLAHF